MENYPWLKSYPDFVPHEVDVNVFPSILAVFEESVRKFGDRAAFINMDVRMSFNELDEYSNRFAWYLQNKTKLVHRHKAKVTNKSDTCDLVCNYAFIILN